MLYEKIINQFNYEGHDCMETFSESLDQELGQILFLTLFLSLISRESPEVVIGSINLLKN